jgi:hypothetical protein
MRGRFRTIVALLVGISWLVLLVLMWRAYRTVPTAEQLADARHVRPPLPADLLVNFLSSTVEAAVLLILLWPQWARRYILRVTAGLIGLVVWFFVTVPLDLNTMEWLHRRWLALMILVLLLIPFIYPFLDRRSGVRTET